MSKWALYHDFDEFKCEVVRQAIKAKAITDGEVICGDIKQLTANDVRGFRRAHFFCGGGFWDVALNQAGWGDEPVWTGSCPCPSFSCAGKGSGFDDPRHLWPDWFRLIRECKPPVLFGEQADDAVGFGWVDLVQANLEAEAYAFGKVVLGAHSKGAPHIRQRLYFCADTYGKSGERGAGSVLGEEAALGGARIADGRCDDRLADGGEVDRGADAAGPGRNERRTNVASHRNKAAERIEVERESERPRSTGSGPNAERNGRRSDVEGRQAEGRVADGRHRPVGDGSHTDGRQSGDRDLQRRRQHGLFAEDCGVGSTLFPNEVVGCGHAKCQGLQECECERRIPGGAEGAPEREEFERGSDILLTGGYTHMPSSARHGYDRRPSETEEGVRGGSSNSSWLLRDWRGPGWLDPEQARLIAQAGATRGFWADCDWWYGRDGKYRPIGPGLFPLAHGGRARVGRLRLYGDGIVVPLAQEFVEAYRDLGRGVAR